jgi:transcriptional regulator with XRE-family HTH domain
MPLVIPQAATLLTKTCNRLGLTQRDLGDRLGVSMRTVGRWVAGKSNPGTSNIIHLAKLAHPQDPELAAELAVEAGTTLAALGLEKPRPAPARPPRAYPPVALVVDSVVHAAGEAQRKDQPMRDVVRAAFDRARGLGLSIDEVCAALGEP